MSEKNSNRALYNEAQRWQSRALEIVLSSTHSPFLVEFHCGRPVKVSLKRAYGYPVGVWVTLHTGTKHLLGDYEVAVKAEDGEEGKHELPIEDIHQQAMLVLEQKKSALVVDHATFQKRESWQKAIDSAQEIILLDKDIEDLPFAIQQVDLLGTEIKERSYCSRPQNHPSGMLLKKVLTDLSLWMSPYHQTALALLFEDQAKATEAFARPKVATCAYDRLLLLSGSNSQ